MRRLWAASAAIVVCLLLGVLTGASTLAQEAEPTAAVRVTGTETLHSDITVPPGEMDDGVLRIRGIHATTDEVASDPRVSGSGTIVGNADVIRMHGPQWGTFRIENEGGAWEGTWRGVNHGGSLDTGSAWLVGSGENEGLTYDYSLGGNNSDLVLETEGLIFPGEAPAP
jgi:hypothetical protein